MSREKVVRLLPTVGRDDCFIEMGPSPTGMWVRYSDYRSLLREVEELEKEREVALQNRLVGTMKQAHAVREAEADRDTLKAKLEECEKKCEELRFGKGVHWPDDIRAELEQVKGDRDRLREKIRALGKAWACSDPEGPSTREEMTANECAADLCALLDQPAQEEDQGDVPVRPG